MIVTFNCPFCGAGIEADGELGGDQAECPHCNQTLCVPAAGINPGSVIAGYEVCKKLGTGGMGEVFLARQVAMDRKVALKVLPPAMTKKKELVDRFLHEIRMAAQLEHPNIVTAFDAGEDAGYYYLAMSYIEGEDLHDRLARIGHMGEHYAFEIALKVAQALDYAWETHKILHRDIKPANIMIDKAGEVKLMDMGIAKSLNEDSNLTMAGMFVGTPYYMSPEQAKGQTDIDCRADIYSLGATLYNLVTGKKPFEGPNPVSILSKHLSEPLRSPQEHNPELSNAAAHAIHLMMAKNRARRYQSWDELIKDIKLLLAQDPQTLELVISEEILHADLDSGSETSSAPAPTLTLAASQTLSQTSLSDLLQQDQQGRPRTSATKLLGPNTTAPAQPTVIPAESPPLSPMAPPKNFGLYSRIALAILSLAVLFFVGSGVLSIIEKSRVERAEKHRKNSEKIKEKNRLTVAEVEGGLVEHATRVEIETQAAEKAKRLEEMLEYARDFQKKHPEQLTETLAAYHKVQKYAKGTKYELMVDAELAKLKKELAVAPEKWLKKLRFQANALVAKKDYHAAQRLYTRYRGPFAAETAGARKKSAAALAVPAAQTDATLTLFRRLFPPLRHLETDKVRAILNQVRNTPGTAANHQQKELIDQTAGLLDEMHQLIASFQPELNKKTTLYLHGRKQASHLVLQEVKDFSIVVLRQNQQLELPLHRINARTLIPRIPHPKAPVGIQFKALLAAYHSRPAIAIKMLSGKPQWLSAALAGQLRLEGLTGTWTATQFSGSAYAGEITAVTLQILPDSTFALCLNQGAPTKGILYLLNSRLRFYNAAGRERDSWGLRTIKNDLLLSPKPDIEIKMIRTKPKPK